MKDRILLGQARFEDTNQHGALTLRAVLHWGLQPLMNVLFAEEVQAELKLRKIAPVVWQVKSVIGRQPLQLKGLVAGVSRQQIWQANRDDTLPTKRWWWDLKTNLYEQDQQRQIAHLQASLVLTRPLAKVGERHPQEFPKSIRLPIRQWAGAWPDWQHLSLIAKHWQRHEHGQGQERQEQGRQEHGRQEQGLPPDNAEQIVWGASQTDSLGHVNVNESTAAMERYGAKLLHQAGVPLSRLKTCGIHVYFRKPLFAGGISQARGQLWQAKNNWMLVGGIWHCQQNGAVDKSPSLFCRLRWHLPRTKNHS